MSKTSALALSVSLSLAALTIMVAVLMGWVAFYHGLNSGVTVGHWGGFELVGPDGPGWFVCDGQC